MSSPSFCSSHWSIFLVESIPNFTTLGNLSDTSRQIGEFGLVVIGMTIVMLGGGIDLSVGSTFALANVTALALINVGTLAGGGGGRGDHRRRRVWSVSSTACLSAF